MKKLTLLPIFFLAIAVFGQTNGDLSTNYNIPADSSRMAMADTFLKMEKEDEAQRQKEYKKAKDAANYLAIDLPDASIILPYRLTVSTGVTTSLMFPSKIVNIDRGSDNIISKKIDGVENVLKVKALKKFEKPSSLTVITDDGRIYPYSVFYEVYPKELVIDVSKVPYGELTGNSIKLKKHKVTFEGTSMNATEIEQISNRVLKNNNKVLDKETASNVTVRLKKVFVKNDVLFFPVQINNLGDINYDIDLVKFLIKDKRSGKRTAIQTLELKPVYIYNEKETVAKNTQITQVFALEKFTINKDKELEVAVYEKNGGRNVNCKLSFRQIDKAEYVE